MINRDEIRRKLAVKINYLFEFIKAHLMEETPQYFGVFQRLKGYKLKIIKQVSKRTCIFAK
jgi:hypothetical protein